MSRRISLTCHFPTGMRQLRDGASLSVPVEQPDALYRLYRIDGIEGTMQVAAFYIPDSQYETGEYSYDGAWASLNGSAGTIIPQWEYLYDGPHLLQDGTVLFNGLEDTAVRILGRNPGVRGSAVITGNIDTYGLSLTLILSELKAGLIPICSPASGHVDPTAATVLQWSLKPDGESLDTPTQTGAVVTWKKTGGTEQTITVTTAKRVTLAAGSFAQGDEIQWKVKITANTGIEHESDWMTLITTDGEAVAVPISPVSGIVDGTAPVEFTWSHTTPYGTPQTAAELQQSTDGAVWSSLGSVTGAEQRYLAPAGSLGADVNGTFFWRVRTRNADGVFGPWSAPAQCVVVAPPPAPDVTVDAVPAAVVHWTSVGQEGYQVQVAGYDSGALFGTARSWAVPNDLPDGSYTARVRVVNSFGLWSDWGEWAFTIENIPGGIILLEGAGGNAAILNWAVPDLADVTKSSGTNNGVTYTWKSVTGTFEITRTEEGTQDSVRTIFGNFGFSNGLEKGATYRLRWSGCSTPGVHFGFLYYRGGGQTRYGGEYLENDQTEGLITIPNNATITGARCVLMVEADASPDGAVVGALEVRRVYDRYDLYRDGDRIAATIQMAYQDNTPGVGSHVYVVWGRTNGSGYYTESNAVTVPIRLNTVELLDPETGEVLNLPMALTDDLAINKNMSRAAAMQHWNGTGLPSAELGEARNRDVQLRPSFPPAYFDSAVRLEQLIGNVVHYRDPHGHAFWGLLQLQGSEFRPRRRSYDLMISEVDYDPEDGIPG